MPYKNIETRRRFQNEYYNTRAQRIRDIKEQTPCADCGELFPYYVMDFDHLRDKKRAVSNMRSYSEVKILEEIAKCDLVCANCHRERTYQRLFI
jgi:hypothetical protein